MDQRVETLGTSMDGTPKTAMVAGAAGGYLLGRTKKGKLALAVGLLFLARRLGITPQDLARKGMEQISDMPEFAKLGEQVRDEFMQAARTAVTTTVNRRIDGLSETLRARTEGFAEADGGEQQKTGEEEDDRRGADEESASEESEGKPEQGSGQNSKPGPERNSQRNASPEDDRKPEKRANGRERSRDAKATRR
jgi:hypothetical protein